MALQIYTADQAAELLGCSAKTVEDMARRGELPGIKPGGGWVFPAGALAQRLDQLALEQAAARRKPGGGAGQTAAVAVAGAAEPARKPARGRTARALPRLVSTDGAGA